MFFRLLSLLMLLFVVTSARAEDVPPFKFAQNYTIDDIMAGGEKYESFIREYLTWEGEFFSVARDKEKNLIYDGYMLDEKTGKPVKCRYWSAPSKECLDVALCVKAISGDSLAAILFSGGDKEKAKEKALEILKGKMDSYMDYYRDYPGYGGFMPWYYIQDKVTPTDNWAGYVPALDNGEWIWALLVAEKTLRHEGYTELADRYKDYLSMLKENGVKIFYDREAMKVRADVHILDMKDVNSGYETATDRLKYITGEHGVHEGVMIVMYVTLFGNLTEKEKEAIWKDIKMVRVEHKYGTTWQGYWGSAHESWAYLFMPYRDINHYRDLFRIREIIRSQNARERGYPGFTASIGKPGEDGYLSACGIEGVGSQPVEYNNVFAPYGTFPMILEFSDKHKNNYGLAWLLNMLKGRKMQGPLGGGESGTNDGTLVSYSKTVDGTFPILLALMGGLEKETSQMLKDYGVYEEFIKIMEEEYNETFGGEPLKEPCGFVLPSVSVPEDKLSDYVCE